MIPGDPAMAILGVESTPEDIAMMRETLGLNKGVLERYLIWGANLLSGNLGNSFKYGEPVSTLIKERLPLTLEVAIITVIMVVLVSVPVSFSIYRIRNKYARKVIDFLIGLCVSLPSFWIGILSMFIFGVILRWFSIGYNKSFTSLLLPCLVIAIPNIGVFISLSLIHISEPTRP